MPSLFDLLKTQPPQQLGAAPLPAGNIGADLSPLLMGNIPSGGSQPLQMGPMVAQGPPPKPNLDLQGLANITKSFKSVK